MTANRRFRRIAYGCLAGILLSLCIPAETFAGDGEYIEEEVFSENIEALPDGGDAADAPGLTCGPASDAEGVPEVPEDLFEGDEEPELTAEEGIEEDLPDPLSGFPEGENFCGDEAGTCCETASEEAEDTADTAPSDPAEKNEVSVGSAFLFSGSKEAKAVYNFTASSDTLHVISAENTNSSDQDSEIHFELYDKDGNFLRAGTAESGRVEKIRCILSAGESYSLAVTGASWGTAASFSYSILISSDTKDFYAQRVGEEYFKVSPNEQVTMSVKAVSDCTLSYEWTSTGNDADDSTDSPLPVGTDPSYVYTAVKNRIFECKVSDADGCSESFRFEVIVDNDFHVLTAKNGTHKSVLYLKPNESITLEPFISGRNLDSLSFFWDDESFSDTRSLTVAPEEGGTYKCSVMDVYGNIDAVSYELRIENNFQAYPAGGRQYPDGTYFSDVEMYADPGDTLSLEVMVKANDKEDLTYDWYDSGNEMIAPASNQSKMFIPYLGGCVYYSCHVVDKYLNSDTVSFFISPKLDVSSSGVIAENEKTAVTGLKDSDSSRIFSFTPRTTSAYVISSEEAVDNYIFLYDGNRFEQLAYNSRGDKGFSLQYNFAAGKTYYVKVGSDHEGMSDPLSFNISVAKPEGGETKPENGETKVREEGEKAASAHVHSFGEWTAVLSPTVLTEGAAKRSCSCGAAETKALPKLKPTAKFSVSGTVSLKVKKKKTVKVSGLAAGDFVKSASSNRKGIVRASVSGNKVVLKAGKKAGTANIKITLQSGLTKSIKVKVTGKSVTAGKR